MKKTILHSAHLKHGAKMSPFGGFDMPLQYSGIIAEHTAARSRAAVFDTCHMGEISIQGPNAVSDLEKIVSSPVSSMETGQCRYGLMCNAEGGVIDDEILYRFSNDSFLMVVNSGTYESDYSWICRNVSPDTRVENKSEVTAKIDLQGPLSPKIMQQISEVSIRDLKYFRFLKSRWKGNDLLISRTGYTGEIGFEIYSENTCAEDLWDECLRLGAVPAGLGARDTLRLEMGMPLYGHELSIERNAAESGFVKTSADSKTFIGSVIVADESKSVYLLTGLQFPDRRAARHGDICLCPETKAEIGVVTSGSFAPSLGYSIALAYVRKKYAVKNNQIEIKNERKNLIASVTSVPFYRAATGRKNINDYL